jgi:branched-chain amino acid transport system permease protein
VLIAVGGYLFYSVFPVGGWLLGLPVALAVPVGVALLLHKQLYRRMPTSMTVVLAALGVTLCVESLLQLVYGPSLHVVTVEALARSVDIWSASIKVVSLIQFATFVAVVVGLELFLRRSKAGLAMRAVMADAEVAELVGVRSDRVKVLAYVIGSALGALTGVLLVLDTGVTPASALVTLLYSFIVTILGNGKLLAVAAWSLGIGVFRYLLSWQVPVQYEALIIFVGMFAVILLRAWRQTPRAAFFRRAAA